MATIEDKLWDRLVWGYLVAGPGKSLDKKEQQALANALQQWVACCITLHLRIILRELSRTDLLRQIRKDPWQIHYRGSRFLGAVRRQEVDVWLYTDEAGLVLAVDPKHFQSQDSWRKNWQNGLNDLIAFATNLHERFPVCAMGGVIAFPSWFATDIDLQKMHGICLRSTPRERPLNAYGRFEGFAIVLYDESGRLVWRLPEDSPLRPQNAFRQLAEVIYARTVALL